MDRDAALILLRGGTEGVKKWNRLGFAIRKDTDFRRADLRRADLSGAKLYGANLYEAEFIEAKLIATDLRGADVRKADLSLADLWRAQLKGAQLWGANLSGTDLSEADLSEADLSEADLTKTNLSEADLSEADLSGADLSGANLNRANINRANLNKTNFAGTNVTNVDLSSAIGLELVTHGGASSLGTDAMFKSHGKIPPVFLRGCGLTPWEIEMSRFYDNDLDAAALSDQFSRKFLPARAGHPISIGGVFISYSTEDSVFAERMRSELYEAGASVWLDSHDMLAGDLHKQIGRAMRLQDIVLLILSESSIESDWVEHELETAREKEKEEKRDVLCPIALDDSWKAKVKGHKLWRQVKEKNVLDFSKWESEFAPTFRKLVKGLQLNYKGKTDGQDATS